MRTLAIPTPVGPDAGPLRSSLGGHPFLPRDLPWPTCPKSGEPMVFFFQLELGAELGLAQAPGSHLAVFMSPAVNEIPTFDFVPTGQPLPDRFWEKRLDHFKVYLFGPEVDLIPREAEPRLVHHRLDLTAADDKFRDPFLVIGGEPRWYQAPELHPDGDGASLSFLCQLSENYPFPKEASAPPQPDSFSGKAYCLFLGNSVYFFAGARPPHPEAVWIVVQN
jgi:hypothetical protein